MPLLKNHIDFIRRNQIALLLSVGLLLTACDVLIEDVLPRSEPDETVLDSENVSIKVRPEEQYLLDLFKVVKANTELQLSIVKKPQFGTASIQDDRWLSYLANAEFPGEDLLVIAAKRNQEILDQDTIRISAPQGDECSTATPTFRWVGSLSKTVLSYELPVSVEPDSCFSFDPPKGRFEILTPPEKGKLQVVGAQFLYEPIGTEEYAVRAVFQQCLDSICVQGILNIEMKQEEPCQVLAVDDNKEIEYNPDSVFSSHRVDVLKNDSVCGNPMKIEVLSSPSGTQSYVENGLVVIEIQKVLSVNAQLTYKITDVTTNESATAVVHLTFVKKCEVTALDDFLTITTDSAVQDSVNYFIRILDNDTFCDIQQLTIQITETPSLGGAAIDDMGILYRTVPGKELQRSVDSLRYRICQDDSCDEAEVVFQFE